MSVTTAPARQQEDRASGSRSAAREQIRGSSLLLAGRFLSKGSNFVSQVLIVRYLSQSDYGAFAYALAMVHLFQSVATLGLDRAVTRFLPIYHERQEYDKLFGTIALVVGTIVSLGLMIAAGVYAFQGLLGQAVVRDEQALALLLVLVFLAPVQAIDEVLVGLFALFANARAIFFRKHILAPGLKLLVVVLLLASGQGVLFLAAGYLAAGLLGVGFYAVLLARLLEGQGLLAHFDLRRMAVPWREVFAFTLPLLTSDLVYVTINAANAGLLQYFHDARGVAALRAVQPTALMNQMVMASFATLFVPTAARLFARGDREAINHLYWQTAVWIAVFSFPVFALTFSLAGPVTVLLYGERYAESGVILALLSLGYYFNAALGLNGLTLKVYGRTRYIVAMNLAAVAVSLGAGLLWIPRFGAVGAALAIFTALVVHNVLKQLGLVRGTGIRIFDPRYAAVYLTITFAAAGLWLLLWLTAAPVYVGLAVAMGVSLAVFMIHRSTLDVEQTFPELLRFRILRRLFGVALE